MPISLNSTKAELFAAYTALAGDAQAQRHTIKALREDLVMQQARPTLPTGAALHTAYYQYIAQCRLNAKRAGIRVVSYLVFKDWCAKVAFDESVDIDQASAVISAKRVTIAELPEAML